MNPRLALELAAGAMLALILALGLHWRSERDQLRSAVSIAAHAGDAKGRPIVLGTKAAIAEVRVLGKAVDDIKLATAHAEAADAQHINQVERADAQTDQEVSANVLAQLEQTRSALDASRILAAERLRAIAAARTDQGGGSGAAITADPDTICDAYFAASCDQVLTLLAAAESNTAQLLGWQAFWPAVKRNHDGSPPQAADEPSPLRLGARILPVIDGGVGAKPDSNVALPPASSAAEMPPAGVLARLPLVAREPAERIVDIDRAVVAAPAPDPELETVPADIGQIEDLLVRAHANGKNTMRT